MTGCKNLELAREWAEWVKDNPDVYGGTSDRARAAADLISSLPDQWVGAEKLREVVADHHIDMSEELMEALGALLPTPPAPRTMDEIEWDDAEHHLAEAIVAEVEFDGNISDTVIMLGVNRFGNISALDTSTWAAWALSKDTLTPTGRKYRLEPEDDTPASTLDDDEGGKRSPLWAAARAEVDRLNQRGGEYAPGGFLEGQAASPRPEDVPEFDPAYLYRDKDGDKWTHNGNGWVCNDSDQGFDAPPAEYGPYTRIEA